MKRLYLTAFLLLFCLFFTGTEGNQNETEIGSPLSEIRFLDVGQGDCTLLRTPQGDVLIDAGTEDSQERLCLRLAQLGVKELAVAVFTHNDEDHIGGADGVLSQIPTHEIWVGDTNADNESAERLFQTAAEKGISVRTVRAGEIHHVGDLILTVLHPFPFQTVEGNEGSVVLKIHYRGVNMIFAGDVGSDGEHKIAERYGSTQLDCDVLKIAHHGSNTSTSDEFLQATTAQYAVISCGAGNSYGHPMGEVLARLERYGITTLRTDLHGEIVFVFEEDAVFVWGTS